MKISKSELKRAKSGFVLGELNRKLLIHPFKSELNQHLVVYGQSGVGKTATFFITNMLYNATKAGDNIIVTDPKGELYNATADTLRKNGYKVLVLNFKESGFNKSLRYNPVANVKTLTDAQELVNSIIRVTSNPASNSDPMWENAEKNFLTSIIMYVKEVFKKELHNLGTVVALGVSAGHRPEELDYIFRSLKSTSDARRMYSAFRMIKSEETRSGVLIGFGSRMQHFLNQEIIDLTSSNDLDFKELFDNKTALFVMLETSSSTFKILPSMFFSQLFRFIITYTEEQPGPEPKLPRPVRVWFDEFANIGVINDFDNVMSTIRYTGASVVLVLQTLTQLQKNYPDPIWSTITGNCDTHLILGSTDKTTIKHYSEFLGSQTIEATHINQMSTNPMMSQQNVQVEYIQRDLMTIDEMFTKKRDLSLVIQSGRRPALVKKVFYKNLIRRTKAVDWREEIPSRTETFDVPDFDTWFDEIAEKLKEKSDNDKKNKKSIDQQASNQQTPLNCEPSAENELGADDAQANVLTVDEDALDDAIFGDV